MSETTPLPTEPQPLPLTTLVIMTLLVTTLVKMTLVITKLATMKARRYLLKFFI